MIKCLKFRDSPKIRYGEDHFFVVEDEEKNVKYNKKYCLYVLFILKYINILILFINI